MFVRAFWSDKSSPNNLLLLERLRLGEQSSSGRGASYVGLKVFAVRVELWAVSLLSLGESGVSV